MKLRIFASLLTALALTASTAASAQQVDYTPRITVSPLVASPGVARTITVSGISPQACQPIGIHVDEHPGRRDVDALTLRFNTPMYTPICPSILGQTYSFSTTYTPAKAGRREVVMSIYGESQFLGFGEIITSESATETRSGTDITGVWYDAARNGSGFAFHHSHDDSGVLAGTFYGFDNAGRPYWYLIQSVRWPDANRFTANLVEITSQPGSCFSLNGCNRLMQTAHVVGTVYGEIMSNGRLDVGFWVPAAFQAGVIERFELQRLDF